MPRFPVRLGAVFPAGPPGWTRANAEARRLEPGRLDAALAESYTWRCAEHLAAGTPICVNECCGRCWFLDPGSGCQLGPMRPVRCKLYPLVPQEDRVLVHSRCPDAERFVADLARRDPAALALLDVAVAMSDLAAGGAEDNSLEIEWLMDYAADGFGGKVVWRRGVGLVIPPSS